MQTLLQLLTVKLKGKQCQFPDSKGEIVTGYVREIFPDGSINVVYQTIEKGKVIDNIRTRKLDEIKMEPYTFGSL